MSEKFDPSKHLRNIKGKGGNAEYLDVKWRLVWLRQEHPDATTAVEHIDITPDIAIFKATVTIPGGGSASDYGSETPRDFGDYIEKASTKAMGRALAALGYGTQFVGEELNEGDRIVDSPRELPAPRPAPASNGTPAPADTEQFGPGIVPADFEVIMRDAAKLNNDGRPYAAVVDFLRQYRNDASEAQYERLQTFLKAIKPTKAPAAAPAAPPSH